MSRTIGRNGIRMNSRLEDAHHRHHEDVRVVGARRERLRPGTRTCTARARPARVAAGLVHHAPLLAEQVLGVRAVREQAAVGQEQQRLGVVGLEELARWSGARRRARRSAPARAASSSSAPPARSSPARHAPRPSRRGCFALPSAFVYARRPRRLLLGRRRRVGARSRCAQPGLAGDAAQRRDHVVHGGVDRVADAEPLLQVDEPLELAVAVVVVRRAVGRGAARAVELADARS